MADRVGIYLIFYLIKGVAFGNGLHFNVIASMSGNQHSRRDKLIAALPDVGISALVSDGFEVKVTPPRRSGLIAIGVIMIVLSHGSVAVAGGGGRQVIDIFGRYSGRCQDPNTGNTLTNEPKTFDAIFRVSLAGDAWAIAVTNLSDISVPSINWFLSKGSLVQLWCDGTNTYTMQPANDQSALSDGYSSNLVTVSRSQFYVASYFDDLLGASLPWLTYCLDPRLCKSDAGEPAAIPVPWLQPRFSPYGHAFEWVVNGTENDRFVKFLTLVRNRKLDLSDKVSLLRPNFVYPNSASSYERIIRQIEDIRSIPDGWVESEFKCTEFLFTNGMIFPARSQFKEFAYDPRFAQAHPFYKAELQLDKICISEDGKDITPSVTKSTHVFDFRYRKESGERIYRFAQYTLQAGERWKADDDAGLLAEAQNYLTHGPRYDAFLGNRQVRKHLVWLVFVAVSLMPLLVMLLMKKSKNKTI